MIMLKTNCPNCKQRIFLAQCCEYQCVCGAKLSSTTKAGELTWKTLLEQIQENTRRVNDKTLVSNILGNGHVKMNNLLEKLAKLEHEQWQSWVKYISEHYQTLSVNTLLAQWGKNYLTEYKDLSEEEKEKDRVWAKKVLKIINEP